MESIGNNSFEVSSTASLDCFFTEVTILLSFGNITHDSLNILEKFSKVWFSRRSLRDNVLENLDNVFNISDTRWHISNSFDSGAVFLSSLGSSDEGFDIGDELDKVH